MVGFSFLLQMLNNFFNENYTASSSETIINELFLLMFLQAAYSKVNKSFFFDLIW